MLLSLQASELGEVLGKAGVGCGAEQGMAFLCGELPGAWAAHRAAAPLFRLCFNKSFTPSNSLDDFFPYRNLNPSSRTSTLENHTSSFAATKCNEVLGD